MDYKIVSIAEIREELLKKEDLKSLKEFAHKQQELIENYIHQVEELKTKLTHAEQIIKHLGTNLSLMPSDEEVICMEQIQILKNKGASKELDINDVKKLDLLIKNLRLLRSQHTDSIDVSSKNLNEDELIAIATRKET